MNNPKKIMVVSCTRETDKDKIEQLPIVQSKRKLEFELDLITGNEKGLSEVYNEAIVKYKKDYDILVCVHDDVFINDCFFYDKIEHATETFDIVGLAGTAQLNIAEPFNDKMPLSWLNSPNTSQAGYVEHTNDGKNWISFYGPTPAKALVLDGLFIAINLNKLYFNVKFDEQFTFNFYDMDFCISAHLAKLTLGIVGMNVKHLSPGSGILEPAYKEAEELFLKKWKKNTQK